jgi:hypothetical protein
MADRKLRIAGRSVIPRQLGVALALALCSSLPACESPRKNVVLTGILSDAIALDCVGGPVQRKLGMPYGEECRKSAMERRFKVKISRQTHPNRTLESVKEYLVAQRFTCKEIRLDDTRTLDCAFLHEPTMPGLVFGTYSIGLYNWTVHAEETAEGAISLRVEVVNLHLR